MAASISSPAAAGQCMMLQTATNCRSLIRTSSARPAVRCASSTTVAAPATSPAGLLHELHQGSASLGHLQSPAAPPPPRPLQGDFNSRMLFNRGLDTVKSVDRDSIWSALEAAGDKPVVLDMYSKWCGPCRMIYPKLVKLSDKYTDVVFLKLLLRVG